MPTVLNKPNIQSLYNRIESAENSVSDFSYSFNLKEGFNSFCNSFGGALINNRKGIIYVAGEYTLSMYYENSDIYGETTYGNELFLEFEWSECCIIDEFGETHNLEHANQKIKDDIYKIMEMKFNV